MTAPAPLSLRPIALLLDFGGVIFLTSKHQGGRRRAAELIADRLSRGGWDVPVDDIERSLGAGLSALKDWKNAAGRRREPRELTTREIWNDFLASDLGDGERALLAGDGGELLQEMNALISEHHVREGIHELLDVAAELGVRVGIVSNAHSGRSHRQLLIEHGLADRIAVQVYSDEVGIRKPHPGIIELAASALGTTPDQTWYVGDTHDRDLVAGRRAGVGAVLLTRSQHTDNAPYAVTETADALLDHPGEIVALLAAAQPARVSAPLPTVPTAALTEPGTGIPRGILLDHGGVISGSTKDPAAQRDFAVALAGRLRAAGHDVTDTAMVSAIEAARFRHKQWKAGTDQNDDGIVPEISAREFWGELMGADLDPGVRAWLVAESTQLSHDYSLIKSRAHLRPGVHELVGVAGELGIRLAIVSNTVSGRAVRDRLRAYGLLDQIAVSVYSDELGRRKPDASMPLEAIRGIGLPAADCWFVGDKPDRDMAAAHHAGVRTAVLLRGGSTADDGVERSLAADDPALRPDLVVDDLLALSHLLRTAAEHHGITLTTSPTMERLHS